MIKYVVSYGSNDLTVGCKIYEHDLPDSIWQVVQKQFTGINLLDTATYLSEITDCPQILTSDAAGTGRYALTLPPELEETKCILEFYIAPYEIGSIARSLGAYIPASQQNMTPEDVWTFIPRTLTQATTPPDPEVSPASYDFWFLRGDTFLQSFQGIGSLTGTDHLWFCIKEDYEDRDNKAIALVHHEVGTGTTTLEYLMGQANPTGEATVLIEDAEAGNVQVAISASATRKFSTGYKKYDLQVKNASSVATLLIGTAYIASDVTRDVD